MLKNSFFINLFFLLLMASCSGEMLIFDEIKKDDYYSGLICSTILPGTSLPLDRNKFNSACWAMEISQYRSDEIISRFKDIYSNFDKYDASIHRSFWEAVNALYPIEFVLEAKDYLSKQEMNKNYKLTAMVCQYLYHSDQGDSSMKFIHDHVIDAIKTGGDYNNYMNDPIFKPWITHVSKKAQDPIFQELFDINLGEFPVMYAVFRKNRDYPGIAIIKNEKGKWIKNRENILHTRILGRSMSNLYGTITNGNTPQGIYTLLGIDSSTNVFIGPSKTIITGLPVEYSKSEFFHRHDDSEWQISDYMDLLPDSWKDYIHFHEAWYAGLAGRSEIIMHGSTILPELYKDEPFYPLTPSLGCMTHYEKWSKNGRLIESDQQKMVDALRSCSTQVGFLVVVELDDKERAIELKDIETYLK
jgi:hypothetical protein